MDSIIQSREIKQLFHFTCIENLISILQFGLLPKNRFHELPNTPSINDQYRLDAHNDCLSISIGFPNYKMFYSIRKKFGNEQKEWAVIGISSRLLLDKNCLYCVENAASNNVTRLPDKNKMGREAFSKLFDEYPGKPSRQELGIPPQYPTNPQAEVLVPGEINQSYFLGIAFDSQQRRQQYSTLACEWFEVKYLPILFQPRCDYPHWSNTNREDVELIDEVF